MSRNATPLSGVSLTDFARANGRSLTRFAYLICGDRGAAEDLVQDSYVALYRRFGEVIPVAAPVAYARRAIVNAHISAGRRSVRRRTVLGVVPDIAVHDDDLDRGEQDALWHAMSRLPTRQRAVLVLRYYLDLADADIAVMLGCREGTVRSLAARSFALLRADAALRDEGEPA